MVKPQSGQEKKPAAASNKPPVPPSAQETKRPTDSAPVSGGAFAKLPAKFGRYEVEKLLGRGAMGAVYLARDTQLERSVAIKIPRVSGSGAAKLLARLKTEAKAAARIDHPNVCHVYDSGEIDGISFIVMQYVEGETLKDQLARAAKSPAEAVEIIVQLAQGLAEAHAQGIYHRDLKPENIKINRRGLPVIMDFGLAKLSATLTADAGATQKGSILGSPAYMSPEQAGGKVDDIDHRSDIYSLGVILYEMLTGHWPFSGGAMQVMGQKCILDPPSPLSVKPHLNPQLAAVCHKMIAKERQARYQSAEEVVAALKAVEPGGHSSVAPPGAVPASQSAAPDFEIPRFMADDEPLPSQARRKRQAEARGQVAPSRSRGGRAMARQILLSWWNARPRAVKWGISALAILLLAGVGLLAGGAFTKVKTKYGILVVEVNQPGAEVFVDGEQVQVTWSNGNKTATAEIKPGRRQVEVRKDGFSVAGSTITFKEGDREIFRAKLEPASRAEVASKSGDAAPVPQTTPQSAAAKAKSADQPAPTAAVAPFEAAQAAAYQNAWAAHLKIEVEATNPIGMKLRLIPPGEFTMGSSQREIDELVGGKVNEWTHFFAGQGPQHRVRISQAFYLGACEVTVREYQTVMEGEEAANALGESGPLPMEGVSWFDAIEFCNRLSQREGLSPCYSRDGETVKLITGNGYRLPSEAEWECACRAGTTTLWHSGDDWQVAPQYAWYNATSGNRPHPVAQLAPNPFGLFDMNGNVWEWCWDWHSDYSPAPVTDPAGSEKGESKILRGGGSADSWAFVRSASRLWQEPDRLGGFRVARAALKVPDRFDGTHPGQERDDNGVKMKLVWCPPGEFTMGSPQTEPGRNRNRENQAQVTLTRGFWLGKTEVTREQWEQLLGTESRKNPLGPQDQSGFPVIFVSWEDAVAYCRTFTERERKAGRLPDGWEYMLPTEAQWEYACRAGTTTRYSFGDDDSRFDEYGWCASNSKGNGEGFPHAAGLKRPNPWGLFDMHGNVWEFCRDVLVERLPGGADPEVTSGGSERVIRGGSYWNGARGCRSAERNAFAPDKKGVDALGLRVALCASSGSRVLSENARKPPESTPAAQAFVPLFNGKDLTGWESSPDELANWKVIEGVLVGAGERLSYLYTKRDDGAMVSARSRCRGRASGRQNEWASHRRLRRSSAPLQRGADRDRVRPAFQGRVS